MGRCRKCFLQIVLNRKKNTVHFYEDFIQIYEIGYILEIDSKYPQQLHKAHNDLPFLPERMKIN